MSSPARVLAPAAAPPEAGTWLSELTAGSLAALVTLALLLSLGVLAFSPLAQEAARVGAAAAFTTSALSALVYALGAPSRLPTGAPTAPSALIVAGLVATLLADPAVQAAPAVHLPWIVAAVAAAVVLMGLAQLALALFGLVQLVRKVPQTVLAGFMNAIAVLVLLAQFGPLLGFSSATLARQGLAAAAALRPGSLLLGLGTAALLWGVARRWPRAPAALVALVAGTAVYQATAVMLPGWNLGPAVGAISQELPVLAAWSALAQADCQAFLLHHGGAIVGTALAMAVVGVLESILVVLALDQQFGDRTDTRRELGWIGLANVLGGLCGALPLGMVRSRAAAVMQGGGRGRRAAAAAALASAALFALGSPLLAWLPVAVLGGIMLTVAWALVDPWTRSRVHQAVAGERSAELALSLALVAFVLAATVWRGPLFGVGLGVVLAAVLFMRQLSRSLVRTQYSAAQRPSRRVYPPQAEALVARVRPAIRVLELEGALFFGNAEQLGQTVDALPPDCRVMVLDLRRVGTVDETGAHLLAQLQARLQRRGTRLLLAHVQLAQPRGRRLRLYGVDGEDGRDWFADTDRAIEAAELALLAPQDSAHSASSADSADDGPPQGLQRLPGDGAHTLFMGLDTADIERVRACMQPLRLAAGEPVFRQGDAGDALYLVLHGSVSIFGARESGDAGQDGPTWAADTRYASLSPGTLFGEASLLDGGGRSASAVADTDTELLRLDGAALAALTQQHPALGSRLYRNIARDLAHRLRIASAAWAAAAG